MLFTFQTPFCMQITMGRSGAHRSAFYVCPTFILENPKELREAAAPYYRPMKLVKLCGDWKKLLQQ